VDVGVIIVMQVCVGFRHTHTFSSVLHTAKVVVIPLLFLLLICLPS